MPTAPSSRTTAINLYFDLMQRCLTDLIYAADRGDKDLHGHNYDEDMRVTGSDWPLHAHTMIGLKRLRNLQFCAEDVLQSGVPGDFVETGVWRGGACIFMRAILRAYDIWDRSVWVADSFQGLPEPDAAAYPLDSESRLHEYPQLIATLDQVRANFAKYGLLDDLVKFLPGWFRDTLPSAPMDRLAIVRLDGDMYESTLVALEHLYPKLSVGGYLIVDDYGCIPSSKQAVLDYRRENRITEEIVEIDWTGVYWKRTT